MVASLQSLCGLPALIAASNLPKVKRQIFSILIMEDFARKGNAGLHNVDMAMLKCFHEEIAEKELNVLRTPMMKDFIPWHLFHEIGFEMIKFALLLEVTFKLDFKFTENFISSKLFTPKGKIDKDKLARELIMEETLCLFLRFRIACRFFMKDIIPDLWQKLLDASTTYEEVLRKSNFDQTVVIWGHYLLAKRKKSNSDASNMMNVPLENVLHMH